MALPIALFAMIVSFALASAAVLSSVDAQQGTKRDRNSKDAIAAADAGASLALLRLNRFQNSLTKATPCVGPGGESQTPEGGWCPPTPTESVGGSTFSYRISAYEGEGEGHGLNVVAVGVAGVVSRRVEVGLISYPGEYPFAEEQLIGQNDVLMNGGVYIHTSIGTNGSIIRKGTSGEICGKVRVGVGQSIPPGELCKEKKYEVTEADKNLPAIVPPENLATINSNCRLVPNCEKKGEVDTYEGKKEEEKRDATHPWEATKRWINVGQEATLTMGGENYLVCGLSINNGKLIMANGGHVRIFVDTPEHCGLKAGETQVEITGNANITSTGFIPAEGKYEVPVIYMLGSPTVSTKAKLCGNSGTNELILYAPNSDVEMCGNATWIGMIAGKSLSVGGNPTIEYDPKMKQPPLTTQTLWGRTHYVECTGASASPPNASC
jgi:hypothetical protein